MSVKLRLARHGRKKLAFYHIVAADERQSRDGKYLEKLGYFNPNAKTEKGEKTLFVNEERVAYWHGVGAQATEAIAKLFWTNNVGDDSMWANHKRKHDARVALKKVELEAKQKAEAEAKAKEEAEAKAAAEAEAAEAKAAEEAKAADAEKTDA